MSEPRCLGVIPARGGSKGISSKNLRALAERPLIAHTIAAAENATRLTRTIVSTDNERIVAAARAAGGDVPFTRPAELATDDALAIDVVQHALATVEGQGDAPYDSLVLLQPTTPFRTAEDIDGAVERLYTSGADSVISVVDVGGHHPARMKFVGDDERLIDPPFAEAIENQPRQQLPPMVLRNGAIYAARRAVILSGSFKGSDSRAWLMPPERSVNIDSADDLRFARWLAHRDGQEPGPPAKESSE